MEKDTNVMNVYYLFKEIWPELKKIVSFYESNNNVVEDVCRIVKHGMKKLQLAFGEFLDEFAQIISNQFQKYKHSSYLYMAEQLVKIFGSSTLYEQLLMNLFDTLCFTALSELNSFASLQEKPELTEDFFGMVSRYLNYANTSTLRSQYFERILILGNLGIGLQQSEAAKCLYGFLESTFEYCVRDSSQYIEYAAVRLLPHFKDVLYNLIGAIVSVVTGSVYEFIEALCYKIILIQEGAEWLRIALVQVPHDCLTEIEKEKFVKQSESATNIHNWLEKLNDRAKRRALRTR